MLNNYISQYWNGFNQARVTAKNRISLYMVTVLLTLPIPERFCTFASLHDGQIAYGRYHGCIGDIQMMEQIHSKYRMVRISKNEHHGYVKMHDKKVRVNKP